MKIIDTKIKGVKIIEPIVYKDARGYFLETFSKQRYLTALGIKEDFVQDNQSRSKRNVLRGMHYQSQNPQGKLVRVVSGEVFDVAVDIRLDSATFGEWVGVYLTADNHKQFWIPPGLAHGFVVLSDYADFEYKCTNYYDPHSEKCLLWNDSDIGIEWPISDPILSEKDQQGLSFKELFL